MNEFEAEFAKFESEINCITVAVPETNNKNNDTSTHSNKKRKLDTDLISGNQFNTPKTLIVSKPVLYTSQTGIPTNPNNDRARPVATSYSNNQLNNINTNITRSISNTNQINNHNKQSTQYNNPSIAAANQLQSQFEQQNNHSHNNATIQSTVSPTTTEPAKPILRSAAGDIWIDSTLSEFKSNDYRLFVGDLGNDVNDKNLYELFHEYKSLDKCKVIRNHKTGKTKGYGFISFLNADDAIHALKHMNGVVCVNRPIQLKRSEWNERNLDTVKQREHADGIKLLNMKKKTKHKKYHLF